MQYTKEYVHGCHFLIIQGRFTVSENNTLLAPVKQTKILVS